MQFLRSVFLGLFLMTSATLAFGQSVVVSNEPQLGPIVLITIDSNELDNPRLLPNEPELGPIIPIAAFFESDTDDSMPPFPPMERDDFHLVPMEIAAVPVMNAIPVRVIGHPIPAPIGEPFALSVLSVPVPAHPDEIQAHLSAAAAHLANAGLTGEAQKIHEFQQHLEREHSQRLLIAFKEAQIRLLQAEIEFLKRAERQVATEVQSSSVVGPRVFEARTTTDQRVR